MSSGGRAPAPDYVGAAREQGRANLEAARLGAELNRVNQQGPLGSVTYTQDPNDPDRWTQTTEMSPEQQALYQSRTANQQGVTNLAGDQLAGLYGTLSQPFSVSGPERISSVGPRAYQTGIDAPSVANTSVDLSSIPGITSDFSAERQRVEDALYGRAASRLDEQFSRSDEDTRTRLLNQGLREGSEAWNNAMRDADLAKQDAYGAVRDRAIAAGGAEQSRLFADALRGRQQSVGEAFDTATFGNQAAQQQFQNEATRANLYNIGQQAGFDQDSINANLANAVRDASIREGQTVRNQPLQEFLSLYGDGGGGSGVTGGNIPGAQGPEAAPIMDAYTNQANAQMNAWAADQQSRQQNINTGVSAATMLAALYFMSDRRAKTDIKRIGALPNGIPTYRYKYRGEKVSRIGVMADEVKQFMPEAVMVGDDGYDRVNYAMIGALHLLEMH